ncbi:RidA family protein [Pelagicoccus albus]|uniref:RidA family protein n=1 Tax=Pelagicoccus albus TaxID=415222 RepID=A0A7X1B8P0_9BACT|nr:RidA family protein [Pelagicoccus albus]MBC2607607.1 RidA family protein [Pelagicoccus albus]
MRFNAFLVALLLCGFAMPLFSQEHDSSEEPPFREPLYFSEVDRDNATPQAVRVGGVIFVSAISGEGSNVEEQIRTIYMRLQSIMGNYGLTMADVAQERIYLKSGESSEAVKFRRQLIYANGISPACSILQVAGLESPEALVAVELIAVASPDEE